MTFIILWIVDKTVGLRVSIADQDAGLDMSEHHEVGYDWLSPSSKDRQAPTNGEASHTESLRSNDDSTEGPI